MWPILPFARQTPYGNFKAPDGWAVRPGQVAEPDGGVLDPSPALSARGPETSLVEPTSNSSSCWPRWCGFFSFGFPLEWFGRSRPDGYERTAKGWQKTSGIFPILLKRGAAPPRVAAPLSGATNPGFTGFQARSTRPSRMAVAAASPRLAAFSLRRMLETWTLAVFSLMNRVSAICRLVEPLAT